MNGNPGKNMRYMAEHTHYFDFHTAEAIRFKQDLQQWWAESRVGGERAEKLQTRFLQLCEANPLETACGWFKYDDQNMSQRLAEKIRMLESHLDPDQIQLPRGEITPNCVEGWFLVDEGRFCGMAPRDGSGNNLSALIKHWRAEMITTLAGVSDAFAGKMKMLRKEQYKALYTAADNFHELKCLPEWIFSALTVCLLPGWFKYFWTMITSAFSTGFDFSQVCAELISIPESAGLPMAMMVFFLIFEICGLLCIPRTCWETYFLIYRRLAMGTLGRRYRRTTRCLTQMETIAHDSDIIRRSSERRMKPCRICVGRLFVQMPRWVKTGRVPYFVWNDGLDGVTAPFKRYPSAPPDGLRSRTLDKEENGLRILGGLVLALFAYIRIVF